MAEVTAAMLNYARISSISSSGVSVRNFRPKHSSLHASGESKRHAVSAVHPGPLVKYALTEPRLGWLGGSHAGGLRPSYAWPSRRSQITRLSAVSSGDRLPQAAEGATDSNESAPPSLMQKLMPFLPIVGIVLLGFAIYAIQEYLLPEGMDINSVLQNGKETFTSMGLLGWFYYFLLYTVLEVLCIPAAPLTASAGYIFGFLPGFLIISTASTFAAAIAFLLARSVLRPWVEHRVAEFPLFRVIDKIIGREGLKVVFLLRLSPLLPFAISNYLYGLTAVKFWEYVLGTWLGYMPGTLSFLYVGQVGSSLASEGGLANHPWYLYALTLGSLVVIGKYISKLASDTLKEVEAEKEAGASPATAAAGDAGKGGAGKP